MAMGRRQWQAWLYGLAAAAVLGCWASTLLWLLGSLALAWWVGSTVALLLSPSLPRRLLPDLGRRAVLITGCSTGFGYAAALHLDALGVRVFAGMRNPQCDGANALRSKASSRLRVLTLDVTKDDEVAAALDTVTKELEEHDCELFAVVNNAGVCLAGDAEWMSIAMVNRSLDVNALGLIRVTQVFLPLLRKSKGRVVNLISLSDRMIIACLGPYVISKHAALAFSETLRVELNKFPVSVHNIEPWIYKTPIINTAMNSFADDRTKIPSNIRDVYTDDYLNKMKTFVQFFLDKTSADESKIYQISEAIEDACLSEDPLPRYLPGGFTKVVYFFNPLIQFIQPYVVRFLYRKKMQQ